VQRKTLGGSQLSSIALATAWKPSSQADWATVHMTNVTSNYFEQNFRVKFRFEGEGGNNFYLDDINLYGGSPSNTIVLGVNEDQNLNNITLYPNPVQDELSVEYNATSASELTVSIVDMAGKLIQAHRIQSNAGQNIIMMDTKDLAAGKYTLLLQGNSGKTTLPFIKH
jgi:hypothetical protein